MADILLIYQDQKLSIIAFASIVIFACWVWIKRDRRLDSMKGPKGYPLIGIGISLPLRAPEVFRKWALEYGEVFKLRVGWYNWVVVNSPEALREIFDKQVRRCSMRISSSK